MEDNKNKQPKIQEPKQNNPAPKQQPAKQQQMPKQNNPALKQTQLKMTQLKTPVFKPDKKIEKYANSNQFRVDHEHDFDNDYEQEFGMSEPEKKLMSNKVIRDVVVDSNVKGNNTGIKNLLDNYFDEITDEDLLNDNELWKDEPMSEPTRKIDRNKILLSNDYSNPVFKNSYITKEEWDNSGNDMSFEDYIKSNALDNEEDYNDDNKMYNILKSRLNGLSYEDDFDAVSDEELLNDDELWKDDNSPIVDFNDERWQQAADDMLSDISWKYQTRNRNREETIDLAGSDLMREYGLNYEDAMRLATEAFYRRYGGK